MSALDVVMGCRMGPIEPDELPWIAETLAQAILDLRAEVAALRADNEGKPR